jgi:hypothetical protein
MSFEEAPLNNPHRYGFSGRNTSKTGFNHHSESEASACSASSQRSAQLRLSLAGHRVFPSARPPLIATDMAWAQRTMPSGKLTAMVKTSTWSNSSR